MNSDFKKRFNYLISLSNKELRKEIENSNWNFILQELRYAGEEIDRLNNIINKLEKWLEDNYKNTNDIWYVKIINKLKELKNNPNLPTS